MTLALLLLSLQDPLAARAESLLVRHELPAARQAAEELVRRHPDDERSHLLLGRVWLDWPVVGRYTALSEFRAAAQLAPADPEPLWWETRVGLRLGDDEGEVLVREAVLRILALDPGYRDAWDLFTSVYHDDGIWARADAALRLHAGAPDVAERRGEIALALGLAARAESLGAQAMAGRGPYVPGFLLRAEAAFDAGQDDAGYAWYDSAVTHADLDSTGAMWNQVWMIASPAEGARQDSTPPAGRPAFFRWFWEKRDPNLVTPENERIAEHFRRLAYVRRAFHLLHPFSFYHRSPAWRAIINYEVRLELAGALRDDPAIVPALSTDSALLGSGLGPARRGLADTVGDETVYLKARFDARGVLWIRHGRPDIQAGGMLDPMRPIPVASPLDATAWEYDTPEGILTVGLKNVRGGGMVLFPITRRQAESARVLLATDGTSLPDPLEARVWGAYFKDRDPGLTDVYYRSAPDTAGVALFDREGTAVVRARGPGLITLTVPPGPYEQGLDVDSAGVLGRSRARVLVPGFSRVQLGLSSLLLAPQDSVTDRRLMLAAMPATLHFAAGLPLAAYTEIYGLAVGRDGLSRYTARYTFAPRLGVLGRVLGRDQPLVFTFTRALPPDLEVPERLVIEPGRLPPGRYRVTLDVTDILRNVKSQTVALDVTIE